MRAWWWRRRPRRGRRWDETKIKALTGGDKITARFMRQDFFDFMPTFKLFICGNHKPRLANVDEAMRRRLLLVPFTVQIPPAERDPQLAEKLEAEWPAILRWCIDGCLEWQRIGLAPPAIVRDATDEYFADQDTLQQWLDDCTEDGGQLAFTRTAELFASWKTWGEEHNLKPGSAQALSEALADRGFVKARNSPRPARLPQPDHQAMTATPTTSDAFSHYHRLARARDVDNQVTLSEVVRWPMVARSTPSMERTMPRNRVSKKGARQRAPLKLNGAHFH